MKTLLTIALVPPGAVFVACGVAGLYASWAVTVVWDKADHWRRGR